MSSSRRNGPLIGMLFPRIDVNHSKAWMTFSYIQTFTFYRLGDEILNVHKFFFILLPSRLLPGKLNLTALALSLMDFIFSSSCRALYYFQGNLYVLSLCSHPR